MKNNLIVLLALILLNSCTDRRKLLVHDFFESSKDTTKDIRDYYPSFDSLKISLKSDLLVIDKDIVENHDTSEIKCLNSFTDNEGFFHQDNITFFITKKGNQYKIINSKGLIKVDPTDTVFMSAIGADYSKCNDLELKNMQKKVILAYLVYYKIANNTLTENVTASKCYLENSYGDIYYLYSYVTNKLPFTLNGVKYKAKCYDNDFNCIAEDEGTIPKLLEHSGRYKLCFKSEHTKKPSGAIVLLDFPNDIIEKVIYSTVNKNTYSIISIDK